ncbi:MAG: response regulator [Planctomycetota bacterium]
MSRPRVLVAEDNRVTAAVIERQLVRLGCDVVAVRNGEAALAAAEADRFDLILSDEQMPRMNGREFCAAARRLPQHADTPIIFCTAKAFEIDHDALRAELGVAEILIKPFSPMSLAATVEANLAAAAG